MITVTEEWGGRTSDARLPSLMAEPGMAAQSAICGTTGSRDSLPTLRTRPLEFSQATANSIRTTLWLTQPAETFDFGDSFAVFDLDGLRRTPLQAYSARIDSLRDYAIQDEFSLNPQSEADFWRFIQTVPHYRKGSLVLIDNGNLRVVWKDKTGDHLGLQFLGEGMLQYVIFKRRSANFPISRASGRDTFAGLMRQIDTFDLESLLGK